MMPNTSNAPSTDPALRPTTSNATALPSSQLRSQTSQVSLRSNAGSAASHRSRQTRDLFAPRLSRRAPAKALSRQGNTILADSDSDRDGLPTSGSRQPRLRRVRRLSTDSKSSKSKLRQEEQVQIVNRQPDGNFLLILPGQAEALQEHLMAPELQDEARVKAVDEEYVAVARQFFTSGASINNGRNRNHEQEYDEFHAPMMLHLRAQVMEKLDGEQWRFEPTPP